MGAAVIRRDVSCLFVLALVVRLSTAALIGRPGYMDTAYYAAGAIQVARGGGLAEPFIWNYLDDPLGLPNPGFLYWMPLPSLLAAPFAALFPGSFFALQIPFVLLAALLPPVAYGLAWGGSGRRRTAWLAGLLTLFSGFFFPYWTLPETFAPVALFGSLALWLATRVPDSRTGSGQPRQVEDSAPETVARNSGKALRNRGLHLVSCLLPPASYLLPLISGALVALAHLTRADGILLLPIVALAPLILPQPPRTTHSAFRIPHSAFLVILGYLLTMSPWFLRNLLAAGSLLSPAGAKTLWLRTYDDLFCYRCDLSLQSYLAWGWPEILRSKLWAAGVNLERFLAEDCLVFLLPFILIGLYRLRRHPPFSLSLMYLFLIYLLHSLVFTFPGPRGGFFHASAPVLPFLFAAGAEGVEGAVGWVGRRRRWNLRQAQAVFGVAAAVLAVLLSVYVTAQKLPSWQRADAIYQQVGRWLAQEGAAGESVMVANPPAFWYHTGCPAVAVPNGDVEVLLAVADRYGVRYVLLDRNRPAALAGLYAQEQLHPRLQPVAVWQDGQERVVMYAVK